MKSVRWSHWQPTKPSAPSRATVVQLGKEVYVSYGERMCPPPRGQVRVNPTLTDVKYA